MPEIVPPPSSGCSGFAVAGDLTIHCAAERSAELLEALRAQIATATPGELHLDLTALADIDSAGLQILVAARRLCAAHALRLRLQPCSLTVQQALDAYRLDDQLMPIDLPAAARTAPLEGMPA
jgi:anti-sigma B factor antagonist